jgi:hypothetical protein
MISTIEKEVPLPSRSKNGNCKYPWDALAVGDSFFAPVHIAAMAGLRLAADKRLKIKTTSRTVEGGVRVWRIA